MKKFENVCVDFYNAKITMKLAYIQQQQQNK